MKYLFFAMCMVCAVTMSLLGMIYKTGRVPFRAPEAPAAAVAAPKALEAMTAEPLSVFTGSGKAVEELIAALNNQRAQYDKRMADVTAREQEIKLQGALLTRLQTDLKGLQLQLDASVGSIKEDEKANLRRLADVYGKMDPANAATSLLVMEKERAATILYLMNERQAAGILNEAVTQSAKGPTTVAEWSDIIRRLSRQATTTGAPQGA